MKLTIIPPILEDIIFIDALTSVTFGVALLIFLTIRRNRKIEDRQSDIIDALLMRIFIWLQLIFGSSIMGGILLEKLSGNTNLIPLLNP